MHDAPAPYAMGLRGTAALLANMSAVGVICLAFLWGQAAQLAQAREDRELYRHELAQLHHDQERQWGAIRALTASVQALAGEVRQLKEKGKP